MNRIGASTWIWTSPFSDNSLGLVDRAREFGFDVLELAVEDPRLVSAGPVREAGERAGIGFTVCGAFGPDRDVTHDDASVRENSLNYITEAIKICQKSGTEVLAGPMYSAVGKRRHVSADQKKREWELAVQGLKEAGKRAGDAGVRLAIEPLNRFETDLVNTAEQVKRLLDEVGDRTIGFHLDSFHMNIEEKNSYDAIKRAGKRLFHFHACENDRGAPGSGKNIDWEGVAKGLKEVNYKYEAVIESFTPKTKSIAAAAAIWRQLASTQDALASEGLAFLKRKLV